MKLSTRYALLLWLLLTVPVYANITSDGDFVHVETDGYTVKFERGVITHIHNKLTDETYTLPLGNLSGKRGQTGILRTETRRDVNPHELLLTEAKQPSALEAEIHFEQGGNAVRLFIGVDPDTGELLIGQEGISDAAGVYGVQLGFGNLNVRNLQLILPAQGGQVIDATSSITSRGFNYPGSWETQLAIIQGEHGGFYVRGADETFQFKRLTCQKDSENLALGFQTHNQAPWDALTLAQSVTWRLKTYAGDYRVPAAIYRDWMEQTFSPWRLSDRAAWVNDIGLVVILALDLETLNQLAAQVDPSKTLLYLVGWREAGYDENYPDYTAIDGFGDFVKAAHGHGFRVMPHVNLVGLSAYHPLYAEFQQYQFRDPWSGDLIGWWWDRTSSPHRHAWINNASSQFRNLLVQQLKRVWETYNVDAFHLDISHVVVNDANGLIEGLNSSQGNVLMHQELAEAMPGVVFSGEHLHEVTFFRENFAQRWKLPPDATPHPISAFLFSRYTRPYGYLGLPVLERDPLDYQTFLNSYESWGVLPTVRIWGVEELNGPLTQQMLAVARQWQELGLTPDFESDWGADTLFQYTTEAGETVIYQHTPSGSTFVLPNDAGYERVFGVTQAQTHRNLPHWRAYNETTLLGLDPNKSYFLSDLPRDLSQVHINSLPLEVSVMGHRVTEHAALFRLERTDSSLEVDLLSQVHLARTGIVVNETELPIGRGATFIKSRSTLAGIAKEEIHAPPPYQGVRGDTFGEFMLTLPASRDIRLDFYMGLWDGSQNSDGVTFIVSVEGDEIFRQHYNQQKWEPVTVDLSPYRGKQVKLRLTTSPGPNGNASWDWAVWGEPKVIAAPDNSPAQVGFFSPVEPTASSPDTLRPIGNGHYSVDTVLPGHILFFLTPGEQVVPPYELRDTAFTVGFQFDDIFRLEDVSDIDVHFGSAKRSTVENPNGERKPSIFAHPPANGQTIVQFPLQLPQSQQLTFSFSMVLQDNPCSNGVLFQILVNGQKRIEHLIETPDWVDAELSLAEFAGQTVLLELITDPTDSTSWGANCDWAHWADPQIIAEANGDVNQDGTVNLLDLILVAGSFGQKPPSNPRTDVNGDGTVNIMDLVAIVQRFSQNAAAPSQVEHINSTAEQIIAIHRAVRALEAMPNKSQRVQLVIELLRHYLSLTDQHVKETKLLPNYPNPFNPETWIPYQLAKSADVQIAIYNVKGELVRRLELGYQRAGYYTDPTKTAYWDGQNRLGQTVASGVYFYQLQAGEYAATRRMVILK